MSWIDKVKPESFDDAKEAMAEKAYVPCPTKNIRFWLPQGQSTRIVFLDEGASISLFEHAMKIGKDFRNYATCLKHIDEDCPLCVLESKVSKYKIMPFTVIDRSEYVPKAGKSAGVVVSDRKKLFVAKSATFERIARKAAQLEAKGLSLRGAMFEVVRSSSDKSPSVGDDFDYLEHVDLDQFEDSTVYDYEELFAPNLDLVISYIEKLRVGDVVSGGEALASKGVDY